ncbi:MAG: hypothetical protein VW378_03840 [bacterium]
MEHKDIRESEFITLEEGSCLTGKSIHTLRKAVKTRPIRYHDDVRNGRRVLVLSRVDLLKYYKSVDQLATRLDQHGSGVNKVSYDVELLMENISFLKTQLHCKDEELRAKNQQFSELGDQLRRKDEQIKHLHVMMRHFQKEQAAEFRINTDKKLDEELEALSKLTLE